MWKSSHQSLQEKLKTQSRFGKDKVFGPDNIAIDLLKDVG